MYNRLETEKREYENEMSNCFRVQERLSRDIFSSEKDIEVIQNLLQRLEKEISEKSNSLISADVKQYFNIIRKKQKAIRGRYRLIKKK